MKTKARRAVAGMRDLNCAPDNLAKWLRSLSGQTEGAVEIPHTHTHGHLTLVRASQVCCMAGPNTILHVLKRCRLAERTSANSIFL